MGRMPEGFSTPSNRFPNGLCWRHIVGVSDRLPGDRDHRLVQAVASPPLRPHRHTCARYADDERDDAFGLGATGDLHDIEFEFLFGGWSWRDQSFRLWRLYWAPYYGEMRYDPIDARHLGRVRFIGTRDRDRTDPTREVVGHAKKRLSEKLRAKYGKLWPGMTLDMEPWEVLIELIRAGEHPTVGGAPQLAKVYRSMNSVVFSVMWPDRNGSPTLLGRRLLGYETTDAPMFDPDFRLANHD